MFKTNNPLLASIGEQLKAKANKNLHSAQY